MTKKKINSRQKGASGERELAKVLSKSGILARRGQQFSGSSESPDIVTIDSLRDYHIECKRVERFQLYDALEQAIRDAPNKIPLVMHRKNSKPWVAILRLEDLLSMLFKLENLK